MEHVNVGKDKLHIALQLTSMGDSTNIHLLYSRGYGVMMEFDGRGMYRCISFCYCDENLMTLLVEKGRH